MGIIWWTRRRCEDLWKICGWQAGVCLSWSEQYSQYDQHIERERRGWPFHVNGDQQCTFWRWWWLFPDERETQMIMHNLRWHQRRKKWSTHTCVVTNKFWWMKSVWIKFVYIFNILYWKLWDKWNEPHIQSADTSFSNKQITYLCSRLIRLGRCVRFKAKVVGKGLPQSVTTHVGHAEAGRHLSCQHCAACSHVNTQEV